MCYVPKEQLLSNGQLPKQMAYLTGNKQ
ncbi:MAG: hypothetical protein JWP57_2635, partial [Spirosoma sp.]|nr:hypothetical protein [Spirosoma sp.]